MDETDPMFAAEIVGPTVDFLAPMAAGGALEFAVGSGRIAVPLAERGARVHGIDISSTVLEQLHAKGGRVTTTLGDYTTTTVDGTFSLVYLVWNSLSNVTTQEGQVAAFGNAAAHLAAGGSFVVELFVPQLRRLPPGQDFVPFDVTPEHLGFDEYDVLTQRLVSHHYSPGRGGYGAGEFRYAWPSELDLMARLAGMTLSERWAGWGREPVTENSPSHVSVWTLA
ncbi:MAG TPA: class I SAM-dependent methyltransferase [Gaiellaceae bacterium]|nr:class I SAM-dependent methyltransferase [Gaiellaceae bacterium]